MSERDLRATWQLLGQLDGYVTTQLLYVAARLDLPGVLATGPKSGVDIARTVGAEPGPLVRVLRGLMIEDVLAEVEGGRSR